MAHLAIDLHTMDESAQQFLLLLADCAHVHEHHNQSIRYASACYQLQVTTSLT